MLPPDGRAVLVELLRPPPGTELVRGIATTFSLDLVSALTAPLAFASHRLGSGQDPLAVLEAVRLASNRLDIFCQAGAVTVPARYSELLASLEEMVHPVRSPHPGGLFHPKIWLLEFSDGTETMFRFLCASRNLTGDRSWDVVVRLDGTRGSRPHAGNRPLRDLTLSLPGWAIQPLPSGRVERLQALADAVRYAEWEEPTDVIEVVFHALGVSSRRSSLDFSGNRHLLISPFATDEGIARVAPDGSHSVQLVSRVEDLDRLDPKTLAGLAATYVVDDVAALDLTDDGASGRDLLVGLHAKTYVIERGHAARVLLGSANATRAAFDGNIEFLVELIGTKAKLGIGTFMGPDAPFRQMLVDYRAAGGERAGADEQADLRLRAALRSVAALPLTAAVTPDGELYEVRVTAGEPLRLGAGITATLELLSLPGRAAPLGAAVDVTFSGVELAQITPFLVIRATDSRDESRATVVIAALAGDPPERHDELLARQVSTPEKFLRLLALMMSLGAAGGGLAELPGGAAGGAGWHAGQLGVFESLVRALGSAPAVLADIAPLVERLQRSEQGRKVLPDGFAELWELVWAARGQVVGQVTGELTGRPA
jgi:hypothetical protein